MTACRELAEFVRELLDTDLLPDQLHEEAEELLGLVRLELDAVARRM